MDVTPLVFDNGSYRCRVGFAGNDAPARVFPTKVGYSKTNSSNLKKRESYVGEGFQNIKEIEEIEYPITQGIITDYDSMEKIWQYCFNELKCNSSERPVLHSDSPLNPKADREKISQYMFESFLVPSLYISFQSFLSLLACGVTTACVLSSGDSVSSSLPMYYGNNCFSSSIIRWDISGRVLTNYLMKLLNERGYSFNSSHYNIIYDIKHKLGYVAMDFEKEMEKESSSLEQTYTLPDGQIITIGNERFKCAEALFKPSLLLGMESLGIHEITYNSIMKSSIDIRRSMFNNIVLSGGTTKFSGFSDRLDKEIKALAPAHVKVSVVAPPERLYSAWIGGSILASLESFHPNWITKKDYDEVSCKNNLYN